MGGIGKGGVSPMWSEIWPVLLQVLEILASGAIGAAIINGINQRKLLKMQHEFDKEDKAQVDVEKELRDLREMSAAQSEALKFVLYDRIRYIGQAYITEGSVDFDDRRVLNNMHNSYHSGLGGNGDLDTLMAGVNSLPLKQRT